MLNPSSSLKKSPPMAFTKSRLFRSCGGRRAQRVNSACAARVVSLTEGTSRLPAKARSAATSCVTSPPAMKEIWLRRSDNSLLTGVADTSRTLVRTPWAMMSVTSFS